MTDKEYNYLLELSLEHLHEKVTKEEALRELVDAGILDESGNFTAPYADLAAVVKKIK